MKHDYHERKVRRIENARKQSQKNERVSADSYKQADELAKVMQGEPIKIGHHSEKRHRRDVGRMHDGMRRSVEATHKAEYYADKAVAIENNTSISSDNPDALTLLRDKLGKLEMKQEFMKAVNKCVRKGDKDAFMKLPGASEKLWEEVNDSSRFGGKGFAQYELTNNSATIRQTKKRIEELENAGTRETAEILVKGVRVVQNIEANRVQLIFPRVPREAVRTALKKGGFRWSPQEGAWQRHLNNSGVYAARYFLETFDEATAYEK